MPYARGVVGDAGIVQVFEGMGGGAWALIVQGASQVMTSSPAIVAMTWHLACLCMCVPPTTATSKYGSLLCQLRSIAESEHIK